MDFNIHMKQPKKPKIGVNTKVSDTKNISMNSVGSNALSQKKKDINNIINNKKGVDDINDK